MKIFIGTDHAGFGFKEKIVEYLRGHGYQVEDKGARLYNEEDDYPDFVMPVAEEISRDPNNTLGIILGATGQGEAMAANKYPHVRAVVYYGSPKSVVDDEADVIIRSRQHNDSNILSLGARYLTEDSALAAVQLWLKTEYSNEERHIRRLGKIEKKVDELWQTNA